MIRKLFLALLLIMLPLITFSGADDSLGYTKKLIRSDYQEVSFEIDLERVDMQLIEKNGQQFTRLAIDGAGVIGEFGFAQLPAIRELVWIPEGANVSLEVDFPKVSSINLSALGYSRLVYPAQPPRPKMEGATVEFVFNSSAYEADEYLYIEPVRIIDEGYLRSRRFVTVEIRPVAYNPSQGNLMVRERIVITLKFKGADSVATNDMLERYDNYYHWSFSRSAFINPDGFGSKQSVTIPTIPIGFLAIVPPDFLADETFNVYKSWLGKKGYYVTVLSTADTTGDEDNIKGWIAAAYETWDIPPTFVLLVGDTNSIGYFDNYAPTDLYFGTVAGSDYFPDIFVGRMSVTNATQLQNILNKLISYEQVLWAVGDAWIPKASFLASSDNFNITEGTHNFVIDTYLTPLGYWSDKFYSHQGAQPQWVIDAINEGRSLVIYSGHGSEDSWVDGPVINANQVRNLYNPVYPLVCSFACLTGSYEITECFGETWIRTTNGAVVFWGSSVPSYWDEDDILERKQFEGFFANPSGVNLTWVEGMFQYGKLGVYQQWGNAENVQMYFEMYNCFGDPSADIWTAPPIPISVEIPQNIDPAELLVINVGIANLLVGVTSRDAVLASAFTDATGVAQIQLDPNLSKGTELLFTVTGHNIKPFFASSTVGDGSDDDDDDDSSDDDDDRDGGGAEGCGC